LYNSGLRKRYGEEVTESEKQEILAKLIELGFWGADEPGDPTSNPHDAGTLNNRLQAMLAKNTFLVSRIVSDHSFYSRSSDVL
jgi:hypothetical protein